MEDLAVTLALLCFAWAAVVAGHPDRRTHRR